MKPRLLLHPRDEPMLSVAIRAAGCFVELRVNDVPVFRDLTGSALDLVLPVNEWLFQGPNEIRLESRSLGSPRPVASMELRGRRLRGAVRDAVPLAAVNRGRQPVTDEWVEADPASEDGPAAPGDVQPGVETEFLWERRRARRPDGTLVLAGTFAMPTPWPVCPWRDAAVFGAWEDWKDVLWQVTQQFWANFQRRDLQPVRRVMTARTRRVSAAYGLNTHEVDDALLFPQLLQSSDWQAAAIRKEGLVFEVAGRNRLARLVGEETGESPLRLINETSRVEAVIDAWWGFDGNWVLLA